MTDQNTEAHDCVLVPRSELAKIEQARKDLFSMLGDSVAYAGLSRITQPMWEVANRKWPDAHSQRPNGQEAGQWIRCTPDLINAGVDCAKTPRRDGDGTYSHDHFIAHGHPPSPSAPDHSALVGECDAAVKSYRCQYDWTQDQMAALIAKLRDALVPSTLRGEGGES